MKQTTIVTRREFMKKSSAATVGIATGLSLWGTRQSWAGANDRVRVAVVGIRGHGKNHYQNYSQLDNVEVAALCEVDENLLPERLKWFEENNKPKPKFYYDIRKLLEDKDIDAISVATPNHWHALMGIWAAQAGKHAHLEKPFTHNVFEGQQLIKAAKKYKVIIHHGTELRSSSCCQEAMKLLHEGVIGEVYMAKGICYKWRDSIGKYPDGPIPEGENFSMTIRANPIDQPYTENYLKKVHYDLWMGPAPQKPFSRNRFHYNWHWQWDYGNGDIGNQGIHQMDVARWGLGVTLPVKISSLGGHFMFDDDQETPNSQISVFEFPNPEGGGDKKKILQFEVRHWITNNEGNIAKGFQEHTSQGYMVSPSNVIGNIFYGSEGYMVFEGNWFKTFLGRNREPGPSGTQAGSANLAHYQNFIDAIRANDPAILKGNVREGHYSCALVHLANTSYRLGRSLNFDPNRERYIDDDEANKMLTRKYRKPYVITTI